jgi:hypothetical protein
MYACFYWVLYCATTMPLSNRKDFKKVLRAYRRADEYCKLIEDAAVVPSDAAFAAFHDLTQVRAYSENVRLRFNAAAYRRACFLRDIGWRHPQHGAITMVSAEDLRFVVYLHEYVSGDKNLGLVRLVEVNCDEKNWSWKYLYLFCYNFCTGMISHYKSKDAPDVASAFAMVQDPAQQPSQNDCDMILDAGLPKLSLYQAAEQRFRQFQLSDRKANEYPDAKIMYAWGQCGGVTVRMANGQDIELTHDLALLSQFSYDPFLEFLKGVDTKSNKPNSSNVFRGFFKHELYDRNILGLISDRDNPIARRYEKSMAREEALRRRAEAEAEANKSKQPRLRDYTEEKGNRSGEEIL